jgi:hypothetical protein
MRFAVIIASVLMLSASSTYAQQVLPVEPPFPQSSPAWSADLYEQKLDGTRCPAGQVFKIHAGSGSQGIGRTYQCVPRPAAGQR